MLGLLFSIFLVLHGLVHVLYFGQSARYFELESGMSWPDGAWAFPKLLTAVAVRNLASGLLILTAAGLVTGVIGILIKQAWWRPAVIGSTLLSTLIFILFWDGSTRSLASKGGVGLLIDLVILAILFVLRWSPVK